MWQMRLRDSYGTLECWKAYADMYGLASKLGFKSAYAAWIRNPLIQGSSNPRDFKVVKL